MAVVTFANGLIGRRSLVAAGLLIAHCLSVTAANAKGQLVCLSKESADYIAERSAPIDVSAQGTWKSAAAVSARTCNIRVMRYVQGAAAMQMMADQLLALQDDVREDLSADYCIRSTANVAAEMMGSDQLRTPSVYTIALVIGNPAMVWGIVGDTIGWGTGDDTIFWGTGDDSIVWDTGDTIVWSPSVDTIVWGTGDDTIFWGTGDDIVYGIADRRTIDCSGLRGSAYTMGERNRADF